MRGLYIALEGPDGVGKSTQAVLLAAARDAALTREPGGTALGTYLRELLIYKNLWPNPRAETLLFCADRAQHIEEVVAVELAKGRDVVTDRSYGSTLAFQGHARNLPIEELSAVTMFAAARPVHSISGYELPDVIVPDVSVLLEAPYEVARQRISGKRRDQREGNQLALWHDRPSSAADLKDKFEHEGHRFWERVRQGYSMLCDAEPERWVRVDSTGSISEVAARVASAVAAHPAMRA